MKLSTKVTLAVNAASRWFRLRVRPTLIADIGAVWADMQPEIRRNLMPAVRDYFGGVMHSMLDQAALPDAKQMMDAARQLGDDALADLRNHLVGWAKQLEDML